MEWKEVTLGEIGTIVGGATPSTKNTSFYDGNIPWLTPKDLSVNSNKYILRGERNITEAGFKSCSCKMLPKGSVLFSSRAPIGYVAIVANDMCTNQGFKSVIPNEETDSEFLYYLLKYNKDNIASQGSGTTFAEVSGKTMKEIEVMVPKETEDQRRIASILSSLDRKIELNNKINADLEEMAQAIFKNWFVDFEPFKNGKFVDSELGMIPEGWKVGTLGELCNFKRGKNLLTKNAIDEGVPVVAGGLEPSCYHNVANTGAPVITVSGSGANAGFMRMYHVPVWASDCSFIDISCENFYFVYCFLKVNSKLLKHAQTGAVQPHVKPSDIHDFELAIPDKESIYDFQDKVKPFFDKIASIQKENSRLSLLRDTLLPRLMSGELEVPE
ncbi:restriction endonuclease subunit S [Prevotella sp. SGI.167]|uniref:restriction endonuclease subunit S n=1 Tax=Prevotella sp. SGI.167 TaxID=3420566 RepID=UPI0040407EAD